MKLVTHLNPDLDAVASIWLIKRFLPGWDEAEVAFLPEKEQKDIDMDPEVLHVDVGRGKLDHHQTREYLSATKLVWNYIRAKRQGVRDLDEKAIERMVEIVTEVDNARDMLWGEYNTNRYKFYLHSLIDGIRGLAGSDEEAANFGMKGLDAVFLNLKSKIRAEEEIKSDGQKFQNRWGKGLAIETGNEAVLLEGEGQGFVLIIRKDPKSGAVRIFARSDSAVDLTEAYNSVRELDPESDWYLHQSKKMLLNQSSVNPGMRPTKLTLDEVIKLFEK